MSKRFFSVRLNIKEIEKNVLTKGNNLRFVLQLLSKFSDSLSDFRKSKFLQYSFCICGNPWNQVFSSTNNKKNLIQKNWHLRITCLLFQSHTYSLLLIFFHITQLWSFKITFKTNKNNAHAISFCFHSNRTLIYLVF